MKIMIKKYIDYRNSNEFKLKQIGYNETEIKDITKLKDDQIKAILKKKYNRLNIKFIRQKYFFSFYFFIFLPFFYFITF